ncbi:MAG TPA: glycosyltransferase family 2 protein [Steroidobacteraceae bacterium]|nr:glycosyltransferase family 2 protein [Steroidobacteraceae bacterium]
MPSAADVLTSLFGRGRRPWSRTGAPKLVALTATRNEDWVLGLSLRVSLSYCDAVVITDHGSTDRTAQIICEAQAEFPDRQISVLRNDDNEWMEMDVRQEMLERGRRLGGTHFIIADADEVPTGNLYPDLRALALSPGRGCLVSLPMISTYHAPDLYRWDGLWGEANQIPWAFCDSAALRWKISDAYQLHRRVPYGAVIIGPLFAGKNLGGLFHLQFVNKTRLRGKAVWYKMIETLRYPGKRSPMELNRIYDWTLRDEGDAKIDEIPDAWWAPYREKGWLRHFAPDAASWQLFEARRLVAEHGKETFRGLDLHGIV